MYRFLDRPLADLDPAAAQLVGAMRDWVAAMQGGRCPCTGAAHRFGRMGLGEVLPDFAMMMFTLNGEALETLRFGPRCCAHVGEDGARLLTLLDAPIGDNPCIAPRLAAGLVAEAAVPRLVRAASIVAVALAGTHLSARFDQ